DPRVFTESVDPSHASLLELAKALLAATSTSRADEINRALTQAIHDRLVSHQALLVAGTIAAAPSPALARALWRCLIAAWARASRDSSDELAATLFVLPIIIVAGRESGSVAQVDEPSLPGVLADTSRLASILREHGALARNETFALAPVLVASDAIEVARLADLLDWQRFAGGAARQLDLPPTPILLQRGQQNVHLRFLVGTAFAAPGADLLSGSEVGTWGM